MQESEKYEKGIVCEQNPEDGERVEKNTTVEVVVSSKLVGEEITVPDVSGMDEESAQKTLEGEGLTVGTSEFIYSSDYAEGEVIKTTPAAGSQSGQGYRDHYAGQQRRREDFRSRCKRRERFHGPEHT